MTMLQLEDIPEEMYQCIQTLAAQQNCSVQTQVVSLLDYAIRQMQAQSNLVRSEATVGQLLAASRQEREQLSTPISRLDSTALIREDRER